jgi:xylose isomerase
MAAALGILGSIDMNRGDAQLGWDTDQFPNNVPDTAMALYEILKAGGLGSGGLNFDAKVRRQSIDAADLFHGHVGAMDVCARALLVAEKMLQDGQLESLKAARYAGWDSEEGRAILDGRRSLAELADQVLETHADPQPVSARQEFLENLVNRYTEA